MAKAVRVQVSTGALGYRGGMVYTAVSKTVPVLGLRVRISPIALNLI